MDIHCRAVAPRTVRPTGAEIEAKLAGDLSPEEEAALIKELRDAETAALMQQARAKGGSETENKAMTYVLSWPTAMQAAGHPCGPFCVVIMLVLHC